jgi:nucleoside-diphosphate-sugar epimerase
MNVFIRRALSGKPLKLYGSGSREQDFTYIDDVVRAFTATYRFRERARVVYDIASGHSVSMEELANIVLDVCPGTNSEIVHTGEPDPQEEYRPEYDLRKARIELSFEPSVDLRTGIRACCSAARSDRAL